MKNNEWTNAKFSRHIESEIYEKLKTSGFKKTKLGFIFENNFYALEIGFISSTRYLSYSFDGGIRIKSIEAFLSSLGGQDIYFAFKFPLEVMLSTSTRPKDYNFNFNNPEDAEKKIKEITQNIETIKKYSDNIEGFEIIQKQELRKLLFIWRHYREGLTDDYKYVHRYIAVIARALDGEIDLALRYLEAEKSLKEDVKAQLRTIILNEELLLRLQAAQSST